MNNCAFDISKESENVWRKFLRKFDFGQNFKNSGPFGPFWGHPAFFLTNPCQHLFLFWAYLGHFNSPRFSYKTGFHYFSSLLLYLLHAKKNDGPNELIPGKVVATSGQRQKDGKTDGQLPRRKATIL